MGTNWYNLMVIRLKTNQCINSSIVIPNYCLYLTQHGIFCDKLPIEWEVSRGACFSPHIWFNHIWQKSPFPRSNFDIDNKRHHLSRKYGYFAMFIAPINHQSLILNNIRLMFKVSLLPNIKKLNLSTKNDISEPKYGAKTCPSGHLSFTIFHHFWLILREEALLLKNLSHRNRTPKNYVFHLK